MATIKTDLRVRVETTSSKRLSGLPPHLELYATLAHWDGRQLQGVDSWSEAAYDHLGVYGFQGTADDGRASLRGRRPAARQKGQKGKNHPQAGVQAGAPSRRGAACAMEQELIVISALAPEDLPGCQAAVRTIRTEKGIMPKTLRLALAGLALVLTVGACGAATVGLE